jgi:hypothetical protein
MSATRKLTIFTASFLLLIVGLTLGAWLASRPKRIVFSNGSFISVRQVSCSSDSRYYHERGLRLITKTELTTRAWNWLELRFPRFCHGLFTGTCSSAQSGIPRLVIYGDAKIVPDTTGFWEFVPVDARGHEGERLQTDLLDVYQRAAGDGPHTGPCILAMSDNLQAEPHLVRIYQVERRSSARRLLATLQVPQLTPSDRIALLGGAKSSRASPPAVREPEDDNTRP